MLMQSLTLQESYKARELSTDKRLHGLELEQVYVPGIDTEVVYPAPPKTTTIGPH